MSSYAGQAFNVVNPTSNINLPLTNQVLAMKQGTYDVKKKEIQQTLDALGGVASELLRPQDKEYLAAKINEVTNQINQSANRNLTEGSTAQNITTTIKAVANDPNVLNAMENTMKFKGFQAQVQQTKEKNPELYNDTNYTYALEEAGYNDYISGKTNKLGNLQYSNYSDYNKKLNDLVLDLEGKRKDQTVEVPDGQGGVIQTTISGLSPTQLRSVAANMLDPSDRKQIEIDGWLNNGGYNNPEIITAATQKVNADISSYDDRIQNLNKLISEGGLSQSDLQKYSSERETLTANKSTLQKNLEAYTKNPKLASTYIQQERVFNDVVERFAPLYSTSQKYVKDDIYWAQKNYQLDSAKFEYEQQKDAAKNQQTLDGGNSIVVSSLGADTTIDVGTAEAEIDNTISTINTSLDTTLQAYKSALDTESRNGNKSATDILNIYNKRLSSKQAGQSDMDIFRAVVTETDSTNDALAIIGDVNYKANIRALTDDLDLYTTGRKKAVEGARISHIDTTLNNQETFKAFYDNPETKMLWMGKATPVKDVLIAAGLMDAKGNKTGDIKSNAYVLRELEKSYYADAVITDTDRLKTTTNYTYLKKLAASFGEDYKDVINGGGEFEQNITYNPNTKTGSYLLAAKNNGIYDVTAFNDQSLSGDDQTIKRFLTEDYAQTPEYAASLNSLRNKLPNTQVVGIPPSQEDLYNQVQSLASSTNPQFKPSKEATVNIKQDGDFVEISTVNFTTKKGAFVPNESTSRVSLQDFQRNLPQLANRLDFQTQSAIYTSEKLQNRPLISPAIKYNTDSASDLYEWNSEVLLKDKPSLVPYLTNTDSKAALQSKNALLIQKFPEARQLINTAVDNSSNYSVQLEVTNKFGSPKLYIKMQNKNTGDVIHSIKIDNMEAADDFKPILDNAPQVYYSMILDDILQKQSLSLINGGNYPAYDKLTQSLNGGN